MKKWLIAIGLGALVVWFTQRGRGHDDEFTFTELPPDGLDD